MATCFCAGNPCSVPVCIGAGSGGVPCGSSLSCTVLSDTVGVGYRALAPLYGWLTKKPVNAVDPWTNNLIRQDNTNGLILAGMNPADAAATAAKDMQASATMVKPCCTSSWSLTTWLFVIGATAIVLIVGTNAFVNKEL
jgi:hypothetical protein